ncbi:DUF3971 domain-containing protein [Hoeflea olei]|uniref:Uncharacterized protein n=1 Tax=Hoeflea olei TaxID=1480615 RepID=A0A1C1YZ08_9HYPH|nr:DUF3971 domain-containing protein [Hoeflea olei]OCW58707.1 hypothetical protein AWJ14_00300 [Hoeflea olei]
MPENRIDKVQFRKRDIVALHELPSAQGEDLIVVRGHHPRRWTGRLMRWVAVPVLGLALLAAVLFLLLEAGVVDGLVRSRAEHALAQAVGPGYRAELSSAAVRLTRRGHLALEARGVSVAPREDPSKANSIKSVLIGLDPVALLTGRLSVKFVDISGVSVAAPQGGGFNLTDLASFRIDATGAMIEQAFLGLNQVVSQIDAIEAGAFRFTDITMTGPGEGIVIRNAEVRRIDRRHYQIGVELERAGHGITFVGSAAGLAGERGLSQISGSVEGFALNYMTDVAPDRRNGVSAPLAISFSAARAQAGKPPELAVDVKAVDGTITMGGVEAMLRDARVKLVYMPLQNKIEVTRSLIRVGETVLPFTGGLIDADRVEEVEGAGIAFDFVIKEGRAAPGDSDEAPISFDGKALGRFDAAKRLLVAEELALATPQGDMVGSASWRFVEGISPEINLVAQSRRMSTTAVKQFWPYWVGKLARKWVLENLYGGTVSNARIQLAAPAGHYKPFGDVSFSEDQLQIDFDVERARINVAGNIPPLRDTVGHMRLRGSRVDLSIDTATAFFPTGRTVELSDALFSIPATNQQPLMADLSMAVKGHADAVAELISYHPINALDQIGFKPSELSGEISSRVTARFGLIADQSPPPPDWTVDLQMSGVDLGKPVEGRTLTDMDGSLYVTPDRAELKADALVDGARMTLDVLQPVGGSGVAARRKFSGTLSAEMREKMAPGSGVLISGPVGFRLETQADGVQKVSLDLKPARLTVPGIGWTKDKGIAANLTFAMQAKGDETRLSDLALSGKGFAASGAVTLKGGRLATASFDRVALSARDDYHVDIAYDGKTYRVRLGGASIDTRPVIALAKAADGPSAQGADGGGAARVELSGEVATMHGYSDERLTAATISYAGQGARTDLLDVKGVTQSGQAVVMKVSTTTGGETVTITSGDAGAFARFAGFYARMQGGLLNLRLTRTEGPWRRGVIDVRNFVVVGEPRLESLVSTPSRKDGRSLKDAARANVDVSRASFEVANAKVVSGRGELRVSEGIIRGPQIGASFQGTVSDAKGNIDMTGTVMLAYGINRLFAELPVIGTLLGNGRDRGLFGITFRLAGKSESPLLQINPLSVIAPGVFRSIFEYRP